MRIGWIIPTVGAFGAVREMVETSNVWARDGHDVAIYTPDGSRCKWLPCLAKCLSLRDLERGRPFGGLDVAIGVLDWQPSLYGALSRAAAKYKAVCYMGFEPTSEMAAALRGDGPATDRAWAMMRSGIEAGHGLLPDSSWQADWLREHVGVESLPPLGGVNLAMFRPGKRKPRNRPLVVGSGDPRPRKGYDIAEAAVKRLQAGGASFDYATYWGKRFTQPQLVEFLQQADVFVDGHIRGGWCNPVAEAMACGAAVVCTEIGATADFAIDGETALTAPAGNEDAIAEVLARLVDDAELRARLAENARRRIARFDYELVAPRVLAAIQERGQW